jgi:hypothetical protein
VADQLPAYSAKRLMTAWTNRKEVEAHTESIETY